MSTGLFVSAVLVPRRGETRGFWPAPRPDDYLFPLRLRKCGGGGPATLWHVRTLQNSSRNHFGFGRGALCPPEREVRLFIFTLAALVCYECLLALKQRYLDGIHRVPGTIDDSNSLSVFICMTAPVLVAAVNSRLPLLTRALCAAGIALACVGEILTISRAGVVILVAMLAGAAAMTASYRLTARKIAICCVVLLGAAGLTAELREDPSRKVQIIHAGAGIRPPSQPGRGHHRSAAAIVQDHPFGIGLNNWSYRVSNEYGPRLGYRFVPYHGVDREPSTVIPSTSNVDEAQAAPAHCLLALTAGELGYPGPFLLGLLWLRWFQMSGNFLCKRTPDPTRRLAVWHFLWLRRNFPPKPHRMGLPPVTHLLCVSHSRGRAGQPVPSATTWDKRSG